MISDERKKMTLWGRQSTYVGGPSVVNSRKLSSTNNTNNSRARSADARCFGFGSGSGRGSRPLLVFIGRRVVGRLRRSRGENFVRILRDRFDGAGRPMGLGR